MATSLERRIEALERDVAPDDGFTVIARQIVSPGNLEPENRFCEIEGITYTCGDDESPAEFDSRMHSVAEDLNRQLGRIIMIICSPTDLAL